METEFEDQYIGMLFCGSYAYGDPGPTSDIDLFIIADIDWRQKRLRYINDIEVEMFVNPPFQIEKEFQDMAGSTIDMFSKGKIIADHNGTIAKLQQRARELKEMGPRELTPEELNFIQYTLSDGIKDLKDALEKDKNAFEIQYFHQITAIRKPYMKINQQWQVKPKNFLDFLEQFAPTDAKKFRKMLNLDRRPQERFQLLKSFTNNLLERVGGVVYNQKWQTEPDQLKLE